MKHARSNFAAIAIGGAAYVFGGISGQDEIVSHSPVLVADVIEIHKARENVWDVFEIPNAPLLAAFSWAAGNEGEIFVLGGTDGNILQTELHLIDFTRATARRLPPIYPHCTGMGTLVFRQKSQILEHVGGLQSSGINCSLSLKKEGAQWTENKRQHSLVANESGMELTNNSAIYFA